VEVATSGLAKSVGTSPGTPQIRLRPAASFPTKVAAVRQGHKLLFNEYKAVKRQVRALVAIGVPFVIRSNGRGVLVDRHPDFRSGLVDKELARLKREAVGKFAGSLLAILNAVIAKRKRKGNIVAVTETELVVGPYEKLRQLTEALKKQLPEGVYNGYMEFLRDRGIEGQVAERAKKTEGDLDRYEVE